MQNRSAHENYAEGSWKIELRKGKDGPTIYFSSQSTTNQIMADLPEKMDLKEWIKHIDSISGKRLLSLNRNSQSSSIGMTCLVEPEEQKSTFELTMIGKKNQETEDLTIIEGQWIAHGIPSEISEDQHKVSEVIAQATAEILSNKNTEQGLFASLEIIGKGLGETLVTYFRVSKKDSSYVISHLWDWSKNRDLNIPKFNLQNHESTHLSELISTLRKGVCLQFKRTELYKDSALTQYLEQHRVNAGNFLPLIIDDEIEAVIVLGNSDRIRTWDTYSESLFLNFIGTVSGTLERKKIEQRLESTQALFEENRRFSWVGRYSVDLILGEVVLSQIAKDILDLSPETTLSLNEAYNLFKTNNDIEYSQRIIAESIRTGKLYTYEFVICLSNGVEKWIRAIGLPEYTAGACVRINGTIQDITKEKETESILKKNEKKFRSIVEYSHDLIHIIDRTGVIEYVSPNIESILGYKKEEVVGRKFHSIVDKNSVLIIEEAISQIISGIKQKATLDVQVIDNSGAIRWFEVIGTSLPDQSTNHSKILGVARDITLFRKHQEELISTNQKLKEANQKLELVLDASRVGIWDWNMETDETFYSKHWAEMLGYSSEEIDNNPESFVQLLHPDDYNIMKPILAKENFGEGMYFQEEIRMKTKDGKWKWILDTGKVITTLENGKPIRSIGIHQDITDKKENMLALIESERNRFRLAKQYQSFIDSESIYVIKTDMNANYTYMNDYFKSTFESYDVTYGSSSFNTIIPEDHGKCLSVVEYVLNHPAETKSVILRKPTFDGSIKGSKWEFRAIFDDEGNPEEILCVGFDISEQLENLQRLEQLVDITSNQNSKLTNFNHIVSHNIRSHAANLSSLVDMLIETHSEESRKEIYTMLKTSTFRLDETIQNLNEILNINTQTNKPKSSVRIKEKVTGVKEILASKISKYNVEIVEDYDKDQMIYGIPAYIDSIFLNLLDNAIKYRHDERSPKIIIHVSHLSTYTKVSIIDNGRGMDMEKVEGRLFGMYKTFHSNEDARGLGLFITKNQIEAMGGTIEVSSTLNKGTQFDLYFENEKH